MLKWEGGRDERVMGQWAGKRLQGDEFGLASVSFLVNSIHVMRFMAYFFYRVASDSFIE